MQQSPKITPALSTFTSQFKGYSLESIIWSIMIILQSLDIEIT